jgi:hypothetical protein
MALALKLGDTVTMPKKKIGRPNEERKARELLERIARKSAAPKKRADDPGKPLVPSSLPPK